LLGHFRHEVGHFFWDILVRDAGRLDACRAVFGDDRVDYGEALKRHYAQGAPADWQNSYISSYATAHPWEDFAETWAHYLHIVDTLETASAFGLRVHPTATKNKSLHADIDFDPHHARSVQRLIDAWLPLTFALNSLNRSMGHSDLYPFILSEPMIGKLQFIHEIIHDRPKPARTPRKRGFFSKAVTPEQPPASPPSPPGPPAPRPELPPTSPPIIEPPADPLQEPPPVELPPGQPDDPAPPVPDELPPPVPMNVE
jgi:hypothetical protein